MSLFKFSGHTQQALHPGPAFGPTSRSALGLARLFVIFPTPHFFLDTSVFHQLPKPLYRVGNMLIFSQPQLNHTALLKDFFQEPTEFRETFKVESIASQS